jgi:hypothetical protein
MTTLRAAVTAMKVRAWASPSLPKSAISAIWTARFIAKNVNFSISGARF